MNRSRKAHSKRPLSCVQCRHFCDDPEELEKLFQGILILSSTYGSTRGKAGVCAINECFHDPHQPCDDFEARSDED